MVVGPNIEALAKRLGTAVATLIEEDRIANFDGAQQFLLDVGLVHYDEPTNSWALTEDGILALHYLLNLYGSKVADLRRFTAAEHMSTFLQTDADRALAMKKAGFTSFDVIAAHDADREEEVPVPT